jgi:hypothetical protein
MSQIHCKIRRVGPTTVTLENTKYLFMPIPGTKYHKEKRYDFKRGPNGEYTKEKIWKEVSVPEESTSVCDIANEEHCSHLLQLSMYEEYDQDKIDQEKKEAAGIKDPMAGFGVEKYSEAGYVAVSKKKKETLYAGEDMIWAPKGSKIVPFKSEIEAFTFLKEEAENVSTEEQETDAVPAKKKAAKV